MVSDSTTGANGSGKRTNIIIWFAKYLHQFQDAYSPYWSHTFLIRSRWSFPLFLWPHCVIQWWYCKEKLDVSHSWGQTVTCMLLLTSYFCFYFQRWRESVVSTFWDSINPKVIFGTWYQIIKGIFCCSLYIFAAFVWKAVVVRLFPRVLNLNNQTIESKAGTVNTTPALIYLQIKSPTWTCIFMITDQNKKTLFHKGVVACTCKTTYRCVCTHNSSHLLQYITVAALKW